MQPHIEKASRYNRIVKDVTFPRGAKETDTSFQFARKSSPRPMRTQLRARRLLSDGEEREPRVSASHSVSRAVYTRALETAAISKTGRDDDDDDDTSSSPRSRI